MGSLASCGLCVQERVREIDCDFLVLMFLNKDGSGTTVAVTLDSKGAGFPTAGVCFVVSVELCDLRIPKRASDFSYERKDLERHQR